MPADIKGQKMHFWVEAKKDHRPIPDMNAHFLVKNPQKKQFKNSLAAIRAISINLRHYDIERLQDKAYLSEFKDTNPDRPGMVTPLAFLFTMTNKF